MTNINETLTQRGTTHGNFLSNSAISQGIKECMIPIQDLKCYQKEALDMIAHKIARICAGNPNEPDHWHDIAGYATLVYRELVKNESVD